MMIILTIFFLMALSCTVNGATVTKASGETCELSDTADSCVFESHDDIKAWLDNYYPVDADFTRTWKLNFGDSCRQVKLRADFLTLPQQSPGVCQASDFLQIGDNKYCGELDSFEILETIDGFPGDETTIEFKVTALPEADRTKDSFLQWRRGFRVYTFCTEAVTPAVAPTTLTIADMNVEEDVDSIDKCVIVQSENFPSPYTKVASELKAELKFSDEVRSSCGALDIKFVEEFAVTGTTCEGDDDRVIVTHAASDGTSIAQVNNGAGKFCGTTIPTIPDEAPIEPILRIKFVRKNVATPGNGFKLIVCPKNCS